MVSEHRRELPTRESLVVALADQARDELRRRLPSGGGSSVVPPQQEGVDATGSVTITVDSRVRVTNAHIAPQWRNRLGRDRFAGAVFEAYQAAFGQAAEAFALATLAAEDASEVPPTLPGGPPPSPTGSLVAEPEPGQWQVRIRERFAAIRELVERLAAGSVPASHTGPRGYLAATRQGDGVVVGVAGSARRIWYADTRHLREEALAVLTGARSTPELRAEEGERWYR